MMNDKAGLRNYYRALRSGLGQETARKFGLMAQNCIISSPIWKKAHVIGLFASTPGEISTDRLIEEALTKTGAVWLPKILDLKRGRMRFESCQKLDDLCLSLHGIREPCSSGLMIGGSGGDFRPDILLIPGLAFDLTGARLGYGGGFYDRILPSYPECITVGFCFGIQIAEHLPRDSWDIPVNCICTENGLICL